VFGKLLLFGLSIAVFTFAFFLLDLPPISYALAVGLLLLFDLLPLGPLGGVFGIILSAIAGSALWGLGGAALVSGITLNYWGAVMRGPADFAWIGSHRISDSKLFMIVTGPISILLLLIGIVFLVRGLI